MKRCLSLALNWRENGGMCAHSVRSLLDRRRGSVVDDVCLAWGSQGPPWSLSIPSWRTTRRAAAGGLQLRRWDRPGSLSPDVVAACRLASPRCEDCPGPFAGRTVAGGFCMCQRGNPSRVVAPVGVPRSYGAPSAWEALGRLGTAAASGLRRVLGSPGTQGCPGCCPPA